MAEEEIELVSFIVARSLLGRILTVNKDEDEEQEGNYQLIS